MSKKVKKRGKTWRSIRGCSHLALPHFTKGIGRQHIWLLYIRICVYIYIITEHLQREEFHVICIYIYNIYNIYSNGALFYSIYIRRFHYIYDQTSTHIEFQELYRYIIKKRYTIYIMMEHCFIYTQMWRKTTSYIYITYRISLIDD